MGESTKIKNPQWGTENPSCHRKTSKHSTSRRKAAAMRGVDPGESREIRMKNVVYKPGKGGREWQNL